MARSEATTVEHRPLDPYDQASGRNWSWLVASNTAAINQDFTGSGVRVAVVDTGFRYGHADLRLNYDRTADRDFVGEDGDAAPAGVDMHGTAVMGVIGASAGDGGVSGGAPGATLVGYRAGRDSGLYWTDIAQALDHAVDNPVDVVNCSFGPVQWFSDGPSNPYATGVLAALEALAVEGRGGLGTAVVYASGNGRGYGDVSDFFAQQGSAWVITVGGHDERGGASSFATGGESVLLAAQAEGIRTAIGGGWGYVAGTSFAAPQVSAAVALMLEANPGLGIRDVKEILAFSACIGGHPAGAMADGSVDADDYARNAALHTKNGAGLGFSRDYGFGFLDAAAAVRLAEAWEGQHDLGNVATAQASRGSFTADDDGTTVRTISIATSLDVDVVQLDIAWRHADWRDLTIELESPDGTRAVLLDGSSLPSNNPFAQTSGSLDWTFTLNRFWGEDSAGQWRLVVHDRQDDGHRLQVDELRLTVFGDAEAGGRLHVVTADAATVAPGGVMLDATAAYDTLALPVEEDLEIDLAAATVGTVAGATVTIVAGSIESLAGGGGDDRLAGSDAAERLHGGSGDDVLIGRGGSDTLIGGRGGDIFTFDLLRPGEVDTILDFDLGSDWIDLRALLADLGVTQDYLDAIRFDAHGLDACVAVASEWGWTDVVTLAGVTAGDIVPDHHLLLAPGDLPIARVSGTDGDDMLYSTQRDERIDGGDGTDTLVLELGGGVTFVDLSLGAAEGDRTGADTLVSIENVAGSARAERLTGDGAANRIVGGGGADMIDGGGGDDLLVSGKGNAWLFGGSGIDFVDYDGFRKVKLDLDSGYATKAKAGRDQLDGIEGARGTGGNDKLVGDAGANLLDGGNGKDRILGGDGDDVLVGGLGRDKLTGGAGSDIFLYGGDDLGGGRDVIADFELGLDAIDLRPLVERHGSIEITTRGNTIETHFADDIGHTLIGPVIQLAGVNAADLVVGSDILV